MGKSPLDVAAMVEEELRAEQERASKTATEPPEQAFVRTADIVIGDQEVVSPQAPRGPRPRRVIEQVAAAKDPRRDDSIPPPPQADEHAAVTVPPPPGYSRLRSE